MRLIASTRSSARATGVVLALGLTVAACSDGGTAGGSGPAGDGGGEGGDASRLVIAENEPPQTFDPVQALNSTVDEVVIPAYDNLVDFNADNELEGVLAESWEVSDDGTSIQMTLRDDVTFHDGAPLTATDVQYTFDRIKQLGVGVAAELGAYDRVEIVNDHELVIHLTEPHAPFLAALSRVYILNSALVEQNRGDDFGQSWLGNNTAGSGPYQLESYATNQEAQFTKYDDYWGGWDGQADEVVIRYLAESSTQRDALQRGDVDLAMDISQVDLERFETDSNFVVDRADTFVQLYVFFNMQNGPTTDPRVREALTLVYDYQAHVDDILGGSGTIAEGPLPAAMDCHAGLPASEQNLDRARQLFAEAGVTQLEMTYLSVIEEHDRAGTLLQSLLRDVGVELELRTVTFPEYVDLIGKKSTVPQLGMIYAFPTSPDPSAVLSTNFDSANAGNGYNYGWYQNSEVDQLLRSAEVETDQQARCDAYEQAQEIIAGDFATMNITNPQHVAVMQSGVEGWQYVPAHHQTVDVYGITVGG